MFINYESPFIGASPDARARCDCCGEKVLEVKCPHCLTTGKKIADLKCLAPRTLSINPTSNTPSLSSHMLKRNHSYYYQVQAQMLCAGVDCADFMIWSSTEDPHLETIERDENMLRDMITRSEMYFYNVILPELFGKHYTREALSNPEPKKRQKRKKETKVSDDVVQNAPQKRKYVTKKNLNVDDLENILIPAQSKRKYRVGKGKK